VALAGPSQDCSSSPFISHMSTFDMLVVGCGGGPDETNLSAYLIKLRDATWEDGLVGLEAGSGQGALSRILKQNPHLLDSGGESRSYSASEIYSFVRCFLITHAHLDHVQSLALSAGSLGGVRKRVYAALQTLKDLETIFSNRLWPNLASWDEIEQDPHKLQYTVLHIDNEYTNISPDVSVSMMPVNHGQYDTGNYGSAAFFIRRDSTTQEFLFFGDVEPDSISNNPQNINVWRAAAPKIPAKLSTLFIECSWPSGRSDDTLYGHLTPEHLAAELSVLATEVRKSGQKSRSGPVRKKQKTNRDTASAGNLRGALDGLRVYVMHCKDSMDGVDPPGSHLIVEQVRTLVEALGLGAEVRRVEQGMLIEI